MNSSEYKFENKFVLVSPFKPTGDQPQAIANLVENIQKEPNIRLFWAQPEPEKPSR